MKYTIFLSLVFIITACNQGRTYYVDSADGNDLNSGTKVDQPWASISKINSITFKPKDQILLKAGTKYYGQLELKGSGSVKNPIVLSRYGNGPNPAIHGKGEALHTVLLYNVEHWIIKNLEITNHGSSPMPKRRGIIIKAHNYGDCHNIVLDSLEIHHVNGSLVKNKGGGSAILWQNSGDSIPTRFIDLLIQNCYLHHCDRNGINSIGNSNRDKWHPSLGVIIRNNLLEQIPGDGIVPIGCDGALVEFNTMRDCPDKLSHSEAAAGIWPWSSDNTLIQYNEVSGHKAKWDGQGFDADYNCNGTTIQYNYSHDNYGGFLLICNDGSSLGKSWNRGTTNTTIQNNLSINDGIRPYPTKRKDWFSPSIHITGPTNNTIIRNNVIIVPENENPMIDRTIIQMNNWGNKWPQDTHILNNIFYATQTTQLLSGNKTNTVFLGNCFYGTYNLLPFDEKAIFSEPMFLDPNAQGSGMAVMTKFLLPKNSPMKEKGLQIPDEIKLLFKQFDNNSLN